MRFRAMIWKSGTSNVVTVPSKLDVQLGRDYWVTLEEVEDGEGAN